LALEIATSHIDALLHNFINVWALLIFHGEDFSDVDFLSAHSLVLLLRAQKSYALLLRMAGNALLIALQGY